MQPLTNALSSEDWRILGSICLRLKDTKSAEMALCIASQTTSATSENPDFGLGLQLAFLHLEKKQFLEAEQICLAGLDRKKSKWNAATSRIELFLCLAKIKNEQNQSVVAVAYYKEALLECEDACGCNCSDTMRIVEALADCHQRYGNNEKAEMLRRRQVIYLENQYGMDSTLTIRAQRTLTDLCRKQGKHGEALLILRQMLDASDNRLSPDHPSSIYLCAELAELSSLQEHYDESHRYFERALSSTQRVLGPKHELTLAVLENYAHNSYMQKLFHEARCLYEEVLSRRKDLDSQEQQTSHVTEALGRINLKLERKRQPRWYTRDNGFTSEWCQGWRPMSRTHTSEKQNLSGADSA